MRSILPLSAVLAATLVPATAAVLITPAGLTNTSGVSEFYPAANLINDSGLSGAADIGNYLSITHGAAGDGNAWTTVDANGADDYFLAGSEGTPAVFTFDLGGTYAVTDFVFWGYHFGSANGNEGREFVFEFSTDGGGSFPATTTASQPLSTFAVSNAATLALGGSFQADTIRVNITDNHFGGSATGGDRIGLGEVKFIGDVVPEPSSALLSLLSAGLLLRRRR